MNRWTNSLAGTIIVGAVIYVMSGEMMLGVVVTIVSFTFLFKAFSAR